MHLTKLMGVAELLGFVGGIWWTRLELRGLSIAQPSRRLRRLAYLGFSLGVLCIVSGTAWLLSIEWPYTSLAMACGVIGATLYLPMAMEQASAARCDVSFTECINVAFITGLGFASLGAMLVQLLQMHLNG